MSEKINKKMNVLFLPVRNPILSPDEWVDVINKAIFPNNNWKIHLVVRSPMLKKGYKENITPLDIYSDKIYSKKITDKDIKEAEEWLGYSFNSIIYMEYLKYHTKYKPKRKDLENIARHVMFFKKTIKENKIDACSLCFPNDILNITLDYVLKKMNIPSWNLIKLHKGPKSGERRLFDLIIKTFPSNLNKLSYDEKEIDNIYQEQKKALLNRSGNLASFIKKRNSKNLSLSLSTIKTKIKQLKRIFQHKSKFENTFRIKDMIQIYFNQFVNSKINSFLFGWFLFSKVPKIPFFYFPLHYNRDYQISFRESFFNQIELIKQTARSLPVGTKLVVKSHPHFLGSDYSFFGFNKIRKIPNVNLVHYKEKSLDLIKKSIGVITINSSAGYEAVIMNKPVITFGNEFFSKEGIAIKIISLKELPEVFLNVKKDPNYRVNVDERKKLIYEYSQNAFRLDTKFLTEKPLDEEDQKRVISKYDQLTKSIMNRKF